MTLRNRGAVCTIAILAFVMCCVGRAPAVEPPPAPPDQAAAKAAPEQAFSLSWWSVDGGGAVTSGGTFSLTGAIGQPDVGAAYRGGFAFDAGVWSVELEPGIFYDGFESGDTGAWSAVVGAS